MLLERVSMHGYSHGVPQRANVARKFPDKVGTIVHLRREAACTVTLLPGHAAQHA